MTMQRVLAALMLLLACLMSPPTAATVEIVDLGGGDGRVFQRDKAADTEKVQPNNLSLEGTVTWQSLNNGTQAQFTADTVINRRSGGTSGSLRLELWALSAPYSGGSSSGIKMAQGSLNPLQAGFQYTNVSFTSSLTLPTQPGTYYVSMFLTEFSSSNSQNNGFGVVDWRNFSNTLVISGNPGGSGSLTIPGAWTWQISGNSLRVTTERIVNGRSSGTSGTLRLELWALANAYSGGSFTGYKIGQQQYNPLQAGFQYSNIDFTTTASLPPNGTWAVVLMLTEFSSSVTSNNGFGVVDYRNSSSPLVIGSTPPPPPPGGSLSNGVPVTGLSGAAGSSATFTVSIPTGARNLQIRTSGGSGDPDLYVRFGSPVTDTLFDCQSISVTPTESCTFASPSAGTWYIRIVGFSAYSGLTLTASWETGAPTTTVDEPSFTGLGLPLPNPPFPSCPAGFFVATVADGAGSGVQRGLFGLELLLNQPGSQQMEGGLNFGGLLDGSQPAFAGFNFINPANEPQRLNLVLTGNPSSSQAGVLPVRIRVIRQPAPNISETVFETTANLTLNQQFVRSIDLAPSFYVVTVTPIGSASQPGGSADGEVYVSLLTSFIGRPGGSFFSGVVVGGYHDVHPFAGVSGFAAFCLSQAHSASARVFSAPTYGASGARDLRLRVLDNQGRLVIERP